MAKQGHDITDEVEILGMAARLAKITMNDKQCEFMFRVSALIIEKGGDATLKEIDAIKKEVDLYAKKRAADKKRKDVNASEVVWGGGKATFIEEHIEAIHNNIP